MEELLIEVDKNDIPLGVRPKTDFYTGKYIHRSVHLLLINSKKEIMIHQRSAIKKRYPNLITYSVSGTVSQETYEETMQIEMKEEIGITIPVQRICTFPCFDTLDKARHGIFVGESDEKLTIDKREIHSIQRISEESLQKDLRDHPEKYTLPFLTGMHLIFSKYSEQREKITAT